MRTHAEWKVETHIMRAGPPTSSVTRSFISPAALLVKVIANISCGLTPRSLIKWAMRLVKTLVLPEPAPATIKSGEPWWVTAALCWGFKSSKAD